VNEIMADKAAKIEIMNCIVMKFACKSTELNNNRKLRRRKKSKERNKTTIYDFTNHPK